MTSKFIKVGAWAFLLFIVFATLSPFHLRPSLTSTEPADIVMLERVGAFAVLGALFLTSYPRRFALVAFIVFGAPIILELAQVFVPDRHARLIDWSKNLLVAVSVSSSPNGH